LEFYSKSRFVHITAVIMLLFMCMVQYWVCLKECVCVRGRGVSLYAICAQHSIFSATDFFD